MKWTVVSWPAPMNADDHGLTVTSDGTFWPAHEYEINGMKATSRRPLPRQAFARTS